MAEVNAFGCGKPGVSTLPLPALRASLSFGAVLKGKISVW
jgi:hypothetical protein